MSNFLIIFLCIFFGLISGVLGGLGMGGGTLLIPLLTIFLNFDQKLSQGLNLLSFLFMAIFSLTIHFKNGFVKMQNIHLIILSGVFFSILGALLAGYIPSNILRISFGVFLILLSLKQFFDAILKKK